MLINDRQIIINYWDECTSILRCIKIHMATCIFYSFFNNNTMHLIVLLLKIKQLKEETSVM